MENEKKEKGQFWRDLNIAIKRGAQSDKAKTKVTEGISAVFSKIKYRKYDARARDYSEKAQELSKKLRADMDIKASGIAAFGERMSNKVKNIEASIHRKAGVAHQQGQAAERAVTPTARSTLQPRHL